MKKYILIVTLFFAAGISGCKKDYLSLEVNPNQPSVSPPSLTLSGALAVATSIINTNYSQDGVWMQYLSRSGSYIPSPTLDQFQLTNTTYTGVWTSLYQNLTNFNILATSTDASLANYKAIAMIMKAYDFQQLVDQFGDVPYSQAFQPSTILLPAYDKAEDIYADLGKQLDAAIALAKNGGSAQNPGTSDIVFKGDMSGWVKFANSLKLRLAIRSGIAALKTDVGTTSADGFLDGTTQAFANPGYSNTLSGSTSQQSPFYASYGYDVTGNATGNNSYYRANTFFINALTNFNDPRLGRVYAPVTAGGTVYDGNPFGLTVNQKSNAATSTFGPGLLKSPTMNAVLFSGAESLFLQAEALQEGGYDLGASAPASAQAAYEAGITVSFQNLGLTAAQATTYYTQDEADVSWTASSNKLEAIIYQKWFALVGYNMLEPYLEYLRTGYPVLPNPVSQDPAAVSTTLPVRQYYPLSEVTSNGTNVAKEGTINIFTSKLFWEK